MISHDMLQHSLHEEDNKSVTLSVSVDTSIAWGRSETKLERKSSSLNACEL